LLLLKEGIEFASTDSAKSLASEFYILQGELLQAVSPANAVEAEFWYQQAVDNAREVRASMLELRAAMRLGSLWDAQGKGEQARQLLSAAYTKITEGFTTADLQQAKTLLAEWQA
ncbi:MAG TPA: hypothetical protein VI524_09515, partial [Anaerolineales bacterium]|nr:hypothetical protein [Anaerolineales bacterium]